MVVDYGIYAGRRTAVGLDWAKTGLKDPPPADGESNKLPPKHKPVNRYFSPTVSWDYGEIAPRRLVDPTYGELPGFFKCPSDNSAAVPFVSGTNRETEGNTVFQTWKFWGSSYPINWYWPYYYQKAPPGGKPPYSGFSGYENILGAGGERVKGLGSHMLKNKGGRWAAEFIIFYENRMNYAMANAYPRGYTGNTSARNRKKLMGWHRQPDYHAAGFLDGHAAYRRFDTRYVDGPGWTTWPTKPWEGEWKQYNDDAVDDP